MLRLDYCIVLQAVLTGSCLVHSNGRIVSVAPDSAGFQAAGKFVLVPSVAMASKMILSSVTVQ